MYYTDNKIRYRYIDYLTGYTSEWFPSQRALLKRIIGAYQDRMWGMDTALDHVKFFKNSSIEIISGADSGSTLSRHIAIYDNLGRMYPVTKLDNIRWEDKWLRYSFINKDLYDDRRKWYRRYYNFRQQPVPHTARRRCGNGYNRRISYRGTQLLNSDLECKEYNIRGYRQRRVLDAYDLEPVRCNQKSWKKNCKCRHQWERGVPNEKPQRKVIRYEDIWADYKIN